MYIYYTLLLINVVYCSNNFLLAVDEAVEIAHNAIFANHGQNCCAGSRTFVHEKIYDEFVKKAATKAQARVVGDPFKDGVQQGPQLSNSLFLPGIIW